MSTNKVLVRYLGIQPYIKIAKLMNDFTNLRNSSTLDEIWLVEHFPVFTQGKSCKTKLPQIYNNIPIFKSDRGGQITYHAPGQQIMYVLLNLKRRKLSIKKLILLLELAVINTLDKFSITSHLTLNKPGVYVEKKKFVH